MDFIGTIRLSRTSRYTIYLFFSLVLPLFWGVCMYKGGKHTLQHCNRREQKRKNNMCKLFLCFRYVVIFSLAVFNSQAQSTDMKRKYGFGDGKWSTVDCVYWPNREREILQMTFILFSFCGYVFIGNLWSFSVRSDMRADREK